MKRITLLVIVLTIVLASVCWAEEITGTWQFDHQWTSVDSLTKEEIEANNEKINSSMQDIEIYITTRADGTMVYTNFFKTIIDAKIGNWYKCAPNKYIFIYSFNTLTGECDQQIYYIEIKDEIMEFIMNQEDDELCIYYFNKIEEE